MNPTASLVESVQGLLERTYDIDRRIEIGRFIIGDAGYRRFYTSERPRTIPEGSACLAQTLVRETDEGLRACIYYPDRLVRSLERRPPQYGLCEENVDAFATLVEELDHLLLLADRLQRLRPLSLFELELQANVSKYLVVARFLAGQQGHLGDEQRLWVRHHLFDKVVYTDTNPRVRRRYQDAARFAVKFIDFVRVLRPQRRIEILRRFHAAGVHQKIELAEAQRLPSAN